MYKDRNHFSIFARKRPDGKKVYYYYCYDEFGKRVKRSTGATSKAKAMDIIAKRIEQDCLVMPDAATARVQEAKYIDAGEYFLRFYGEDCPICQDSALRGKPIRESIRKAQRRIIAKYIAPFFRGKNLRTLSANDIKAWQAEQAKGPLAVSSVNTYYKTLTKLLNYAVDDGLLSASPAKKIKTLHEEKKASPVFSTEDIRALFSHEWDNSLACLACKVAASTGMRQGEIRALTFGCVSDGIIKVALSIASDSFLKSTKSGKTRYCPIYHELEQEILHLKEIRGASDEDYIFTLDNVKPVSACFVSDHLKKELARCGLDSSRSMHSFRHYFNTMLVANNVSSDLVRNIVGHQSEAMTDRYMHTEIADMADIREVQKKILG